MGDKISLSIYQVLRNGGCSHSPGFVSRDTAMWRHTLQRSLSQISVLSSSFQTYQEFKRTSLCVCASLYFIFKTWTHPRSFLSYHHNMAAIIREGGRGSGGLGRLVLWHEPTVSEVFFCKLPSRQRATVFLSPTGGSATCTRPRLSQQNMRGSPANI